MDDSASTLAIICDGDVHLLLLLLLQQLQMLLLFVHCCHLHVGAHKYSVSCRHKSEPVNTYTQDASGKQQQTSSL